MLAEDRRCRCDLSFARLKIVAVFSATQPQNDSLICMVPVGTRSACVPDHLAARLDDLHRLQHLGRDREERPVFDEERIVAVDL